MVVDAISDGAVAGVTLHIDGSGDAVSSSNGSFAVESTQSSPSVRLTSPVTVERVAQLLVPGPTVVLSVIPISFDLTAFDQMFRTSSRLQRWMTPPRVVLQRRVLQFTQATDNSFIATAALMTDAEAAGVLADLRWALPQATGNRFGAFTGEPEETASVGERVVVSRTGDIVVAEYSGLSAVTGGAGWGRWALDSHGAVVGGIIMLDRGFETSQTPFRRSLRTHELGHALGYSHVTTRASFMNSSASVEPLAFDRDATKIAFQRQPGSRSPDIDPSGYTANAAARGPIVWAAGLP